MHTYHRIHRSVRPSDDSWTRHGVRNTDTDIAVCATLRAEVPFRCCKYECCVASCFLARRIGLSLFGCRKSRRLLVRVGQGLPENKETCQNRRGFAPTRSSCRSWPPHYWCNGRESMQKWASPPDWPTLQGYFSWGAWRRPLPDYLRSPFHPSHLLSNPNLTSFGLEL